LVSLGASVVVFDPYCNESFGAEKVKNVAEAFDGSDCVIIATDHAVFKKLELKKLKTLMKKPLIVDGKRVIDPDKAKDAGLLYYGVGYQSEL